MGEHQLSVRVLHPESVFKFGSLQNMIKWLAFRLSQCRSSLGTFSVVNVPVVADDVQIATDNDLFVCACLDVPEVLLEGPVPLVDSVVETSQFPNTWMRCVNGNQDELLELDFEEATFIVEFLEQCFFIMLLIWVVAVLSCEALLERLVLEAKWRFVVEDSYSAVISAGLTTSVDLRVEILVQVLLNLPDLVLENLCFIQTQDLWLLIL